MVPQAGKLLKEVQAENSSLRVSLEEERARVVRRNQRLTNVAAIHAVKLRLHLSSKQSTQKPAL